MITAIMQPYFFPYGGYFDLISQVDNFILLDDVQYVSRRWINRNYLPNKMSNNKNICLTVPVRKNNRDSKINQIEIFKESNWVEKHLQTFIHTYGKKNTIDKIESFYLTLKKFDNLSKMLYETITWTCNLLNVKTKIYFSSNYNIDFKGERKIIELCKIFNTKNYINAFGGKNLYSEKEFEKNNIKLNFIEEFKGDKYSILNNILS